MACFGFVTFLLLRPLFSFPCFIAFISASTFLDALGEYWREELLFLADVFWGALVRTPAFPFSLMLHGMIFAQYAHDLSTDPNNDFPNEVHSYFGSGTQLQEMYITPSLLSSADWDVLAEAAKWSRANADVLRDTHWVGGDPAWLEVYGWAAWTPHKAILTLRNPSDKPQDINIDIQNAFELPDGAPKRYTARSPWRADSEQDPITLQANRAYTFHLTPFEVLTLEATPK